MNILMMSNTYKPIVGGIERSIETYSAVLRDKGHNVLIVVPEYREAPEEEGVFRVPALQNFNGTDFSVELPVPGKLAETVRRFEPDIVHTHHPFLIGDTALRISAMLRVPVVFTYHTMYEKNTHYVPGDSRALKNFVIELAAGYCDLCDRVIAPSQSVSEIIRSRGVSTKIEVIPTGIETERFSAQVDKALFRKKFGIPAEAFLTGCVCRIEEEKNVMFLIRPVIRFLKKHPDAFFLLAGSGEQLEDVRSMFASEGLGERAVLPGMLKGDELVAAYQTIDIFAYASKSETQGLVLAESMAAGTPVIALDAPGCRDIVEDGINGFLLKGESEEDFYRSLERAFELSPEQKERFVARAFDTASKYSYGASVKKALKLYRSLAGTGTHGDDEENNRWKSAARSIKAQMKVLGNITRATGEAIKDMREGSDPGGGM
jgi:glycosyltransferase involved in cell wall biosynthesis